MAERKIGKDTFRYEKMNAVAGLELGLRVVKILGPALPHIMASFDENETVRDMAALNALTAFSQDMNIAEVMGLLMEMCGRCKIFLNNNYEEVHPDFHLQNELDIIRVAFFALETQFKSFFDEGAGSQLGTLMRSRSASL